MSQMVNTIVLYVIKRVKLGLFWVKDVFYKTVQFIYGSKYIDNYLVKCPHCNVMKKIYDADDGKGILKESKLCDKK